MRLGIVTGIVMEAALVEKIAGANPSIHIRAAGLEPYSGQKAAEALIADGATHLMSFGLAAGLNPAVSAGAVVIPAEIRSTDRTFPCDLAWTRRLAGLMKETPSLLAHARAVLATEEVKAGLFAATGATAADMESFGVAEVANVHGLPFAALRVVADMAADAVPSVATGAMTADGRIRPGMALLGALTHPWQIPDLVRLGRRTGVAMKKLDALARLGAPRLFGLM